MSKHIIEQHAPKSKSRFKLRRLYAKCFPHLPPVKPTLFLKPWKQPPDVIRDRIREFIADWRKANDELVEKLEIIKKKYDSEEPPPSEHGVSHAAGPPPSERGRRRRHTSDSDSSDSSDSSLWRPKKARPQNTPPKEKSPIDVRPAVVILDD